MIFQEHAVIYGLGFFIARTGIASHPKDSADSLKPYTTTFHDC